MARINPQQASAIFAHNYALLQRTNGKVDDLNPAALTEEQNFVVIPGRLARTPGVNAMLPGVDFFRTALVVHVDLSVLEIGRAHV